MQPQSTHTAPSQPPKQSLEALHIPDALLKIQTVTAVTGLSESSIRRKVGQGKFPHPIKDGPRCTRWVAGHVSAWLRRQASSKEAT